jgi:hypothetical protein
MSMPTSARLYVFVVSASLMMTIRPRRDGAATLENVSRKYFEMIGHAAQQLKAHSIGAERATGDIRSGFPSVVIARLFSGSSGFRCSWVP